MEDYRFLPNLSQNLLTILNDDEYYDVTIEVGKDPYVKVFRAHMVILTYRSPYLRRILSTNVKKNDGTLAHIKLPNISPETFQIILRYIYGGRLSLKEYDVSDIIKILIVANELNLQEIVTYLQSFLIVNKKNWMEQNFNLIYKTSFENESLLKLQNFCTELITKEPSKIFKSIDFNSISEKTLISLIRHENLKMSNVQVWEHVLKWGIAQNPELSSDPSSYSKNDFNALKNTLQQCIPFIKFYNLTSREFLNKVYPYRKIIPKDLLDKLFRYFLDHEHKPNNKPEQKVAKEISSKAIDSRFLDHEHKYNKPEQKVTKEISSKPIDSRIITFQHVEIISKWIDKLDITDNIKNSYEFKLILRGSRDGFLPRKFHEICDNQSHTISIIKVQGSNEILGGYNPNIWVSNWCHIAEKDSFIFSFKNKNSIENYILSRVKDEQYAIFNNPNHGPSFGSGLVLFGNDFFNMSYCKNMKKYPNYEKSIRETEKTFSVEEYEIFQITKN